MLNVNFKVQVLLVLQYFTCNAYFNDMYFFLIPITLLLIYTNLLLKTKMELLTTMEDTGKKNGMMMMNGG